MAETRLAIPVVLNENLTVVANKCVPNMHGELEVLLYCAVRSGGEYEAFTLRATPLEAVDPPAINDATVYVTRYSSLEAVREAVERLGR